MQIKIELIDPTPQVLAFLAGRGTPLSIADAEVKEPETFEGFEEAIVDSIANAHGIDPTVLKEPLTYQTIENDIANAAEHPAGLLTEHVQPTAEEVFGNVDTSAEPPAQEAPLGLLAGMATPPPAVDGQPQLGERDKAGHPYDPTVHLPKKIKKTDTWALRPRVKDKPEYQAYLAKLGGAEAAPAVEATASASAISFTHVTGITNRLMKANKLTIVQKTPLNCSSKPISSYWLTRMNHAILAPSSAWIWGNCPGVIERLKGYVEVETKEAREGTAGHWVWDEVLRSYQSSGDILSAQSLLGSLAPNGVRIDQEMIDGAKIYLDLVLKVRHRYGALQSMLIEHRVSCTEIHQECWGTLDTAIVSGDKAVLFDYKYGRYSVQAFNNYQLVCYAVGLMALYPQIKTIDFVIVQPRDFTGAGSIKTWSNVTREDMGFIISKLRTSAQKALGPYSGQELRSGSHCKHCKKILDCPAAKAAGQNAIDVVDSAFEDPVEPELLGPYYDQLKRAYEAIENVLKVTEEDIIAQIKGGDLIPGKYMDMVSTKRRWNEEVDDEDIKNTGLMLGFELMGEKPCTPAQAINKGVPEEVINSMAARGTKYILKDDDGQRAAEVFGK
jgi:hypothetical protein